MGKAWLGKAWLGMAWLGMAGRGKAGQGEGFQRWFLRKDQERGSMKTKLLTEDEVHEWLRMPIATLRNMRSRPGRDPIPFVKAGRLVRYPEEAVQKWIQRNTFYDTAEAKEYRNSNRDEK